MKLPETKVAVLFEKQNWENIIHSEEWVVFRNLLKEHINYLQKELNEHVKNSRDREAYGTWRAMDDAGKILTIVTVRLAELNRKSEEGEK